MTEVKTNVMKGSRLRVVGGGWGLRKRERERTGGTESRDEVGRAEGVISVTFNFQIKCIVRQGGVLTFVADGT